MACLLDRRECEDPPPAFDLKSPPAGFAFLDLDDLPELPVPLRAHCAHEEWTVVGRVDLGGEPHLEMVCEGCLLTDFVQDAPDLGSKYLRR